MNAARTTLKVVPIGVVDLKDVPASLRHLAGMIDDGSEPSPVETMVVSVGTDGEIMVYGYGEVATREHAIGVLHRAILELAR